MINARNNSFFTSDVFAEFQRFRASLIVAEFERPEIQRQLPTNGLAGAVVRIMRFVGKSQVRSTKEESLLERVERIQDDPKFVELCSVDCRQSGDCSFEEECQIKHLRRISEYLTDFAGIEPEPGLFGLLAAKSYKSCVKNNELSRMRSQIFRQYRGLRDDYADAFFKRPVPLPIGSRNAPRKILSKLIRSLLDRFGRAYFKSNSFESLIRTATELLDLPVVSEVLSKRFPKIDFSESSIEEVEIPLIKSLTVAPLFRIITDNEKPSDRVARIGLVAFVFMNREFERICDHVRGTPRLTRVSSDE